MHYSFIHDISEKETIIFWTTVTQIYTIPLHCWNNNYMFCMRVEIIVWSTYFTYIFISFFSVSFLITLP